jgi:two-component system, OmpR family, sensor histidine kinase ChvG
LLDKTRQDSAATRMKQRLNGEAAPALGLRVTVLSLWRRFRRALQRGLASSVSRRIALLNLLGLVAMLLGFLWLNQTRQSVIDARVQSMLTQGEIMASAIAASATVETDNLIIDPDRLLSLQEGESVSPTEEAANELEFSVNPERVAPVLRRLVMPTTLRARVYDRDGSMIIDTRTFFARGDVRKTALPPPDDEGSTLFQRTWSSIRRSFGRTAIPVPKDDSLATGKFQEVARALKGSATTIIRVNTDGQTIIYVATPIQRANTPRGALLLSTQEGDIDQVISDERLAIFMVFLIAAGVMLVLSFLLAGTIADPLRKLAEGAERVRRGTKLRQEIPDLTYRADEIGYLSGTLRDMTNALYQRIEAIESFAADVSHELKNPLTSLRSAVETLPLARNENSKQRLMDVIQHDVLRLDRLISDISDASRLDAELARVVAEAVDFEKLLEAMVAIQNDIPRENGATVALRVAHPANKNRKQKTSAFLVLGHDGRFGQIITNLVDNAISFSPDRGRVLVTLERAEREVVVLVDDAGPGIPDHALERIFERFYTDRPQQGFGQNSGLGLSISRQIAQAYQGTLTAENRLSPDGSIAGARFILRLPAADAG